MFSNSSRRISSRSSNCIAIAAALGLMAALVGRAIAQQNAQMSQSKMATVTIDTNPQHMINSFDPDSAIGAWIDVLSHNGIDNLFTDAAVKTALEPGFGTVSLRNNSELVLSAMHWNENGAWSDPAHKSGYFVGSAESGQPEVRYSPSYSLPHREIATSGDAPRVAGPQSFWKSNPYLTSHFTGESDALHPQWVIVDMGAARSLNTIHLKWMAPYATVYVVQYWIGDDSSALNWDRGPAGVWQIFPGGDVKDGKGGDVTLQLSTAPITARWIRVLMTQSSNTPDIHGADDIRNCVGYAMSLKDLNVGVTDDKGTFTKSFPPEGVTPGARRGGGGGGGGGGAGSYCVSSIDPWHSAENLSDADTGNYEHAGVDVFLSSPLMQGNPALIPCTVIYGNPDDAANEVAYVYKKGYNLKGIEMGEECDGKHTMPEDYAALYCEWATAIHKLTPQAKLGGPVFEGVNQDIVVWPDDQGRVSWMGRFVDYLKEHNHLQDLSFISYEHYPFSGRPGGSPPEVWDTLYLEPGIMSHILDVWREDGVPKDVPQIVSESSMDAGGGNGMQKLDGAIWECDSVASFFAAGGSAYYRNPIRAPGRGGGRAAAAPATAPANPVRSSAFWADIMLNKEWVEHKAGVHQMFPAVCDLSDAAARVVVTSYVVHRPDGNWSLMLVNHDPANAHDVHVVFDDANHQQQTFTGQVDFVTFGAEQFAINLPPPAVRGAGGGGFGGRAGPATQPGGAATRGARRGAAGGGFGGGRGGRGGRGAVPNPDGPPKSMTVPGGQGATYTLPKASVTVLRGKIG